MLLLHKLGFGADHNVWVVFVQEFNKLILNSGEAEHIPSKYLEVVTCLPFKSLWLLYVRWCLVRGDLGGGSVPL